MTVATFKLRAQVPASVDTAYVFTSSQGCLRLTRVLRLSRLAQWGFHLIIRYYLDDLDLLLRPCIPIYVFGDNHPPLQLRIPIKYRLAVPVDRPLQNRKSLTLDVVRLLSPSANSRGYKDLLH